MSREPLAALVARLREMGASPATDASVALYQNELAHEADRLLAAVEAGTRIANGLSRVRALLAKLEHGEVIRDEWDAAETETGIALDAWNSIVAPASHGSPEQGR